MRATNDDALFSVFQSGLLKELDRHRAVLRLRIFRFGRWATQFGGKKTTEFLVNAAVERKLSIIRDTYAALYDEASSRRAEWMEILITVLIAGEVMLALIRH